MAPVEAFPVQPLPAIRADAEDAIRDLQQFGAARLAGAMSREDVEAARSRLDDQAAGEDALGLAWHDSDLAGDMRPVEERNSRSAPNQRVYFGVWL